MINNNFPAIHCNDRRKRDKCIDYITYNENRIKRFYNALMLLESRQKTHIRFWKKLKNFLILIKYHC